VARDYSLGFSQVCLLIGKRIQATGLRAAARGFYQRGNGDDSYYYVHKIVDSMKSSLHTKAIVFFVR
jgi:hypothetical protein